MDLIKGLYENKDDVLEHERPLVYYYDLNDVDKLIGFLKSVYCFDTDLSYEELDYNLVEIFNRLGFLENDSICLGNMRIGSSKYDVNKEGYCTFNYSVNCLEFTSGDVVGYYSNNELFDGSEGCAMYPGVKLTSGNESLYYTVGTGPYIRKYDIKINENLTLTREYSKNSVLFIFEELGRRFVIKVDKPISKVVTENYVLDNELLLLEYLKGLSSFDIVEIFKKLCEISLGKDVSKYSEITLCESNKTENGWKDTSLISIKLGTVDNIIRTIGDKTITWYGNGNWTYVLSDENVTFRINSGKTLKYGIEAKNDMIMDSYTDNLFKYDVCVARREIEDTKKLVKEKLGLSIKKRK